jgi:hypothetical protein
MIGVSSLHRITLSMVPKQPRVNVYLSVEDYEFLKEWATSERRSMGNLAAFIVAEMITKKRQEQQGKEGT